MRDPENLADEQRASFVEPWREPGVEDFESDERRQRLTVAVVGVAVVAALAFGVACAMLDGRRLETLPCGGSVELPDGSLLVVECEGGPP